MLQHLNDGPLAVGDQEVEQCCFCVFPTSPHGCSARLDEVVEQPLPSECDKRVHALRAHGQLLQYLDEEKLEEMNREVESGWLGN